MVLISNLVNVLASLPYSEFIQHIEPSMVKSILKFTYEGYTKYPQLREKLSNLELNAETCTAITTWDAKGEIESLGEEFSDWWAEYIEPVVHTTETPFFEFVSDYLTIFGVFQKTLGVYCKNFLNEKSPGILPENISSTSRALSVPGKKVVSVLTLDSDAEMTFGHFKQNIENAFNNIIGSLNEEQRDVYAKMRESYELWASTIETVVSDSEKVNGLEIVHLHMTLVALMYRLEFSAPSVYTFSHYLKEETKKEFENAKLLKMEWKYVRKVVGLFWDVYD